MYALDKCGVRTAAAAVASLGIDGWLQWRSRWNAEVELRVEGAGEGRGDRDDCASRWPAATRSCITCSCSQKTWQHSQGSTGLSCARFECRCLLFDIAWQCDAGSCGWYCNGRRTAMGSSHTAISCCCRRNLTECMHESSLNFYWIFTGFLLFFYCFFTVFLLDFYWIFTGFLLDFYCFFT